MKLILIFLSILLVGCGSSYDNSEYLERNKATWKACLDAGGIPIEAWYGEWALSDCKFPGDKK